MGSVTMQNSKLYHDGVEQVSFVWRDMANAYAKHLAEAQERLKKIGVLAAEGGGDLSSAVRMTAIQEIAERKFV